MAAIDFDRSPAFGGTTKNLFRTQGILLETMQYQNEEESKTERQPQVPNHLLDTKIYSKIAQNDQFQAKPAVIHFGGIEIGFKQTQMLCICNVSTEVQRMHIIPPQSKYFTIKYTKQDRLVPGLNLECVIEFTPDEYRYYYDCVRIHCKGEENLLIPIHAYPILNEEDFPIKVNFPPTPVGSIKTKKIMLGSRAPLDFEYRLQFLQTHPAFKVHPQSGIVGGDESCEIEISFTPAEFCTAQMRLVLVTSEFNAKPLYCTVTGTSYPGLAQELSLTCDEILDPRCITPVDRARQKRKQRREKSSKSSAPSKPAEVEKDGIHFPENLDTPYAVSQVLNQQPGKLRIKDIRSAVSAKKNQPPSEMTRQMREATFEMAVRQDVYEERQNQLRWQVKLGSDPISFRQRQVIMQELDEAIHKYKVKRGDPFEGVEIKRKSTQLTSRRTLRDVSLLAQQNAQFDTYSNDTWARRHATLRRFQQAARKIIIRRRCDKNIILLKEVRNKRFEDLEKKNEETETDWASWFKTLDPSKIILPGFPEHKDPNANSILEEVMMKMDEFQAPHPEPVFEQELPLFELMEPMEYQVLGYKRYNVFEMSRIPVPENTKELRRKMRRGAEEEEVKLPDFSEFKHLPKGPPPPRISDSTKIDRKSPTSVETDLLLEDVTGSTPLPNNSSEIDILKPPAALFKPIEYPPLHIFNASPGLQVFQASLPYAETDSDFHLCPLPRYTSSDTKNPRMATQKNYLDREETIKGVMSWKRFSSQGLTSLTNTPTLTDVWVPRWNDTLSRDLLPTEVPAIFDELAEDDRAQITNDTEVNGMDEVDEEMIELSPDMVNAQFPAIAEPIIDDRVKKELQEMFPYKMPATNAPMSSVGHVTREKRECELEGFIKKKYNLLGVKINQKNEHLNSLKTHPDLVLN